MKKLQGLLSLPLLIQRQKFSPVTSASPSTRPSFSASRYLVSTPAVSRASSVPSTVRRAPLMSFTNFLRAQLPAKSPAVEVSTSEAARSKSVPSKRRRLHSPRIYKPLKLDPIVRPEELGSESTVGTRCCSRPRVQLHT